MQKVMVESPYWSSNPEIINRNIAYAKLCLLDSIQRGEAPFASHLLYTRVLDDAINDQRALGLKAAYKWLRAADKIAFYIDHGMSRGMFLAQEKAKIFGIEIVTRKILI